MNSKRKYLLPKEGKFYKANLHCHSTFSDGRQTAEEIKRAYKEKGYSVVAFTDHNTLVPHNELTDDEFLSLTGIEIDFNCDDALRFPKGWAQSPVYHINFISKNPCRTDFIPFDRVYDFDTVQKVIDDANADGFLCQYNHPRWSYQTVNDFERLRGLFAFEVYNHGCELEMHNGWGEFEYDHYVRNGGKAAVVATDDNHMFCEDLASPYCDCFGGFTMIKAPALSYDDVIGALERKECYASTGPEIYELWVERNPDDEALCIHLECSPCTSVVVLTDTRETRTVRSHDDDISVADVKLSPNVSHFRVEIMNSKKEKALTRAFFKEELQF